MALLTQIDKWDDKIYTAKDSFAEGLSAVRAMSATSDETLFDEVAAVNSRFEAESMSVSEVYYAGEFDRAEDLHLQVEHWSRVRSSTRSPSKGYRVPSRSTR
jgi:hypothetical protein